MEQDDLDSISGLLDEKLERRSNSQFDQLERKLLQYQIHNEERNEKIESRLGALETSSQELKAGQEENTELTRVNTDMTSDVHEIIMTARSFFNGLARIGRVMKSIGEFLFKILKWGGSVAVSVSAILALVYILTHHGALPPK